MLNLKGINQAVITDFQPKIFPDGDYPFIVIDAFNDTQYNRVVCHLKVVPAEGFAYNAKLSITDKPETLWRVKRLLVSLGCFDVLDGESLRPSDLIGFIGAAHFKKQQFASKRDMVEFMGVTDIYINEDRDQIVRPVFSKSDEIDALDKHKKTKERRYMEEERMINNVGGVWTSSMSKPADILKRAFVTPSELTKVTKVESIPSPFEGVDDDTFKDFT